MPKHTPLEKTITNNCLKLLNSLPRTYARKVPSGPYGSAWPDIVGCSQGRMLALEGKRTPKDHPTDLQQAELDRWAESDAIVGVYRSTEDIVVILLEAGVFSKSQLVRIATQKKR